MNLDAILENLKKDADELRANENPDASYYLHRISDAFKIEDEMERQSNLFQQCLEFYKYTQTTDWLAHSLDIIDLELADLYYMPARWLQIVSNDGLEKNCFFLAGFSQLLTIMLNDNPLESSFAADSIMKWHRIFEADFEYLIENADGLFRELPSHFKQLPDDMTGKQFLRLFELELLRTKYEFAKAFPSYGISDNGEFENMIKSVFNNEDPGYALSSAVVARILRSITFLLYDK